MSDEIKVAPTVIQRNAFDVAVELTLKYYDGKVKNNPDEMAETFCKFLATAKLYEYADYDTLKKLLPHYLQSTLPR